MWMLAWVRLWVIANNSWIASYQEVTWGSPSLGSEQVYGLAELMENSEDKSPNGDDAMTVSDRRARKTANSFCSVQAAF